MAPSTDKPIIFFDGVCGLCSEVVDFIMKIDPEGTHLFSPLQGRSAEGLLTREEREDLDSLVLFQNGQKLKKSRAVFQIFKNLGGKWGLIASLSFLPVSLTDAAYSVVAKYRYSLFGKKDTCRLPTPSERQRFLD